MAHNFGRMRLEYQTDGVYESHLTLISYRDFLSAAVECCQIHMYMSALRNIHSLPKDSIRYSWSESLRKGVRSVFPGDVRKEILKIFRIYLAHGCEGNT